MDTVDDTSQPLGTSPGFESPGKPPRDTLLPIDPCWDVSLELHSRVCCAENSATFSTAAQQPPHVGVVGNVADKQATFSSFVLPRPPSFFSLFPPSDSPRAVDQPSRVCLTPSQPHPLITHAVPYQLFTYSRSLPPSPCLVTLKTIPASISLPVSRLRLSALVRRFLFSSSVLLLLLSNNP